MASWWNSGVTQRLVELEKVSNDTGPVLANLDAFKSETKPLLDDLKRFKKRADPLLSSLNGFKKDFQKNVDPVLKDLEKFKKEAKPRLDKLEALRAGDRLIDLEIFQKDAEKRLGDLEANRADLPSIKGDLSELKEFKTKATQHIISNQEDLTKLDDKVDQFGGEVQKLKGEVGKLQHEGEKFKEEKEKLKTTIRKLEWKSEGPIHVTPGNGMLVTQRAGAPVPRYIEPPHDNGDAGNINVRNYGQLSMHGNLVGYTNIQGHAYNWGAVNSPQDPVQHFLPPNPVHFHGPAIFPIYLPTSSGSPRRSRSRAPRRLRYASSDASDYGAYNYNTMPGISIELSRRKGRGLFSKPEHQAATVLVGGGGGGGGSEGGSRGRRTIAF
jgi:predicted  nucleic acid-binding Zn-ribbon protein